MSKIRQARTDYANVGAGVKRFRQPKPPLSFVNNNPMGIAQRKLIQIAQQSPQAAALRETAQRFAESPSAIAQRRTLGIIGGGIVQRKTKVTWTTQNFQYNDDQGTLQNQEVGKAMVADLDPNDKPAGNNTTSKEMPDLFNGLKANWNPGTKHWVRGHLLNDHLGGPNVDPNLFPITGNANGDHLQQVESHVKDWMRAGKNARYEVTATQEAGNVGNLRNAAGKFECYAYTTSGGNREVVNKTILSLPEPIIGGSGGNKSNTVVHDKNWWQYNNTKVGSGNAKNTNLTPAEAGMNETDRRNWKTNHYKKGLLVNYYQI
ncbi:MAG: DNA/RNA non-specific endonuclease [Nitrosomonas sp.]|nr:DNA/RNA non-specific endonuclease [Nitrosomonas sp.]